MPKVTFITLDGQKHELEAEEGTTLMEIGRDANLGIEGTCGGSLSCATCHVIIDPEWFERTGKPDVDEEDMLDLAFGLEPTSRLGCQIRLDDSLDGLVVKIPEE
tara:strand:- start:203 stop:514 length:312 start_codon:yes stop_codon:yes gene_type:complete